ncbi:MAG: DMT family transporter [Clostridiales bacterium]|nr:DMT family transporter [Clostridiales bacterium]
MAKLKPLLTALFVMALWGSLYPMIKIGYSAFGIDSTSVSDILMFAGVRFLFSGVVLTSAAAVKEKKAVISREGIIAVLLTGLFSIILHYSFTYIGLSLSDSSQSSILKQTGALIYICLSPLFIKDEYFDRYKLIGALTGFAGIAAISFNPDGFSLSIGDIMILTASICSVVSGVTTKRALTYFSPISVTGTSQLFGGACLTGFALVMGGRLPLINLKSILVFVYICCASMAAYCLWNYLIRSTNLSKLYIIKFTEPIFACIFGAILLGENIFKLQYLAALILIAFGILIEEKCSKNNVITK